MNCSNCGSHLIVHCNSGIHGCLKCHHEWLPGVVSQTIQNLSEVAWLIEAFPAEPFGHGNYWHADGSSYGGTFGTVNEATRFARKQDAEAVIQSIALRRYLDAGMRIDATEHEWCAVAMTARGEV